MNRQRKKKTGFPSLASVIMGNGKSFQLLKRTPKKVTETTAGMMKMTTNVLATTAMLSMATIAVGSVAQVAARS